MPSGLDIGSILSMSDAPQSATNAGREHLRKLLLERNQFPERSPRIDAELRSAFEKRVAVLVLDMSGFSRLTVRYGIMHYLAMIAQMEEAATPAVLANGGSIIKQEADNLYAIFPTSADALEGALDIFRAFEAVNSVLPPERHIRGSIGIGFGSALVIEGHDVFGEEMNFSCKLGEDLAEPGEILLTRAAVASISPGLYAFEALQFTTGGICIEAYRFCAKLFEDPQ